MDLEALARVVDALRSHNLTPEQWKAISLLIDLLQKELSHVD
jgi:hypothetical protein